MESNSVNSDNISSVVDDNPVDDEASNSDSLGDTSKRQSPCGDQCVAGALVTVSSDDKVCVDNNPADGDVSKSVLPDVNGELDDNPCSTSATIVPNLELQSAENAEGNPDDEKHEVSGCGIVEANAADGSSPVVPSTLSADVAPFVPRSCPSTAANSSSVTSGRQEMVSHSTQSTSVVTSQLQNSMAEPQTLEGQDTTVVIQSPMLYDYTQFLMGMQYPNGADYHMAVPQHGPQFYQPPPSFPAPPLFPASPHYPEHSGIGFFGPGGIPLGADQLSPVDLTGAIRPAGSYSFDLMAMRGQEVYYQASEDGFHQSGGPYPPMGFPSYLPGPPASVGGDATADYQMSVQGGYVANANHSSVGAMNDDYSVGMEGTMHAVLHPGPGGMADYRGGTMPPLTIGPVNEGADAGVFTSGGPNYLFSPPLGLDTAARFAALAPSGPVDTVLVPQPPTNPSSFASKNDLSAEHATLPAGAPADVGQGYFDPNGAHDMPVIVDLVASGHFNGEICLDDHGRSMHPATPHVINNKLYYVSAMASNSGSATYTTYINGEAGHPTKSYRGGRGGRGGRGRGSSQAGNYSASYRASGFNNNSSNMAGINHSPLPSLKDYFNSSPNSAQACSNKAVTGELADLEGGLDQGVACDSYAGSHGGGSSLLVPAGQASCESPWYPNAPMAHGESGSANGGHVLGSDYEHHQQFPSSSTSLPYGNLLHGYPSNSLSSGPRNLPPRLQKQKMKRPSLLPDPPGHFVGAGGIGGLTGAGFVPPHHRGGGGRGGYYHGNHGRRANNYHLGGGNALYNSQISPSLEQWIDSEVESGTAVSNSLDDFPNLPSVSHLDNQLSPESPSLATSQGGVQAETTSSNAAGQRNDWQPQSSLPANQLREDSHLAVVQNVDAVACDQEISSCSAQTDFAWSISHLSLKDSQSKLSGKGKQRRPRSLSKPDSGAANPEPSSSDEDLSGAGGVEYGRRICSRGTLVSPRMIDSIDGKTKGPKPRLEGDSLFDGASEVQVSCATSASAPTRGSHTPGVAAPGRGANSFQSPSLAPPRNASAVNSVYSGRSQNQKYQTTYQKSGQVNGPVSEPKTVAADATGFSYSDALKGKPIFSSPSLPVSASSSLIPVNPVPVYPDPDYTQRNIAFHGASGEKVNPNSQGFAPPKQFDRSTGAGRGVVVNANHSAHQGAPVPPPFGGRGGFGGERGRGRGIGRGAGRRGGAAPQLSLADFVTITNASSSAKAKKSKPVPSVKPSVNTHSSSLSKSKETKVGGNLLDSSQPEFHKGKIRERDLKIKPTTVKKNILKEREEKKNKIKTNDIEHDKDSQLHDSAWSTDSGADTDTVKGQIHSRRFRDYCENIISKEVDACTKVLVKVLGSFQDRVYAKDHEKGRKKKRMVYGLREVFKLLKVQKIKMVILAPDIEQITCPGGLDDVVNSILRLCKEQTVPYVFALTKSQLGYISHKHGSVSSIGIINFQGANEQFNALQAATDTVRTAYEALIDLKRAELTELNKNIDGSDSAGSLSGTQNDARTTLEPPQEALEGDRHSSASTTTTGEPHSDTTSDLSSTESLVNSEDDHGSSDEEEETNPGGKRSWNSLGQNGNRDIDSVDNQHQTHHHHHHHLSPSAVALPSLKEESEGAPSVASRAKPDAPLVLTHEDAAGEKEEDVDRAAVLEPAATVVVTEDLTGDICENVGTITPVNPEESDRDESSSDNHECTPLEEKALPAVSADGSIVGTNFCEDQSVLCNEGEGGRSESAHHPDQESVELCEPALDDSSESKSGLVQTHKQDSPVGGLSPCVDVMEEATHIA